MKNAGLWLLGFCSVVLGLCGLFVSSHTGGGIGYYGGIAMFAFSIVFVMHLIRTADSHE